MTQLRCRPMAMSAARCPWRGGEIVVRDCLFYGRPAAAVFHPLGEVDGLLRIGWRSIHDPI